MLIGIPLAHIHGGEVTEGVIDEAIRHSISKMSQLHFVSTDVYRKRVIQLGENPIRVLNVGAIGLDRIRKETLTTKKDLSIELRIPEDWPWCVVTYHPVTLDPSITEHDCMELLKATTFFPEVYFIFTKSNADEGGRLVNGIIEDYVWKVDNAAAFDSLGSQKYLSAVASAEMVVGNSSSGIIEVPFLGVPTVDIGIRQQGRIRGESVRHVNAVCDEIREAMRWLFDNKDKLDYSAHPYYRGGAAEQIIRTIKTYSPDRIKRFFDVDFKVKGE
jgi:GDP/UDP-N,N'-diacetylbacillosamine 2-epimerase (hydrolysing)